MTPYAIAQLHPGDQVQWNDPDSGICSKIITIQNIEWHGEIVRLVEQNGSVLECYLDELGSVTPKETA